MTVYGYARVSTSKQEASLDNQVETLLSQWVSLPGGGEPVRIQERHIYKDVASGAKKSRPEFDQLIRACDGGDTIVVTKVDRLGRTLFDTMQTIGELGQRGVSIMAGDLGLVDATSSIGKAQIHMMLVFAELERDRLIERTNEGLAKARRDGKKLGPKVKIDDAKKRRMAAAVESGASISQVARDCNVSRMSVYAALDFVRGERDVESAAGDVPLIE